MGTKNNPGKYDCYEKAGSDEPMFILLGRDKHAAKIVRAWAEAREIELEDKETVTVEDREQVLEAYLCADAMEAYGNRRHGS